MRYNLIDLLTESTLRYMREGRHPVPITSEDIAEIIKVASKCPDKATFRNQYPSLYRKALRAKIYNQLVYADPSKQYKGITFEQAKELTSKYSCKSDLQIENSPLYDFLLRRGWLTQIFPVSKKIKITAKNKDRKRPVPMDEIKQQCLEHAHRCKTKQEFRESYPASYRYSVRFGWLNEYPWLNPESKEEKLQKKHEEFIRTAKQYTRMRAFMEENPELYVYAQRQKWLQEADWLTPLANDGKRRVSHRLKDENAEQREKPYLHPNIDMFQEDLYKECLTTAQQCKTLKEFQTEHRRLFSVCLNNGWLKLFTFLPDNRFAK